MCDKRPECVYEEICGKCTLSASKILEYLYAYKVCCDCVKPCEDYKLIKEEK